MVPYAFWLVLGLMLMIAEVVTPGFILFFFGLSAILVGLLCFIPPIAAFGTLQLILFAVFSVATLMLLRRHVREIFTGRIRDGQPDSDDPLIGSHAVVTERINEPHDGKIELTGGMRSATADEIIEAGVPVEVVGLYGLTLRVRPWVK